MWTHSVDTEKSDEYEYYYVYYDEEGNVVNKKDFEPDSVDQQTLDTAQVKMKTTFGSAFEVTRDKQSAVKKAWH